MRFSASFSSNWLHRYLYWAKPQEDKPMRLLATVVTCPPRSVPDFRLESEPYFGRGRSDHKHGISDRRMPFPVHRRRRLRGWYKSDGDEQDQRNSLHWVVHRFHSQIVAYICWAAIITMLAPECIRIKARIPYRRGVSGRAGLYTVDGFWTFREKRVKEPSNNRLQPDGHKSSPKQADSGNSVGVINILGHV